MHLPKRYGKAGGALMLSDKEPSVNWRGSFQALLLVNININIITSPQSSLCAGFAVRLPPHMRAIGV